MEEITYGLLVRKAEMAPTICRSIRKEAGKMSRAAPPTAFGPEGGPIDKIHADTSFQY